MGYSRSARIKTLLAIDTAFFFLEAIVGYSVGSLALVADSFHMLNDVMSLIVALYALKLAEDTTRSNKYSYGWQRAEILGALINGVFLLALCFSIFMEAIQRLVGKPDVANPKLVVIVGSLGLLSNIVGLFLFHDHGHSHGGGGHSHSHGHSHGQESAAEEGHAHAHHSKRRPASIKVSAGGSSADERTPLVANGSAGAAAPRAIGGTDSVSDTEDDEYDESDTLDDLLVHPARTREAIVRQAYDAGLGSPRNQSSDFGHRRSASSASQNRVRPTSTSAPSISAVMDQGNHHQASGESSATASGGRTYAQAAKDGHKHTHNHTEGDGHVHEHGHYDDEHQHGPEEDDHDEEHHGHSHGGGGGHGHSHGNMNMRGVFLHVLGDALGNVGVIGAGLIIWLTTSKWRFYSDPIISLIITCIIFSSALPLVRSASFILLQGTPSHVPLEKVRSAILRIPNVISVHDLHIWSLSESKLVASLHILVRSNEEFQQASFEVRKLLHRFGVHSSTIQPELLDDKIAVPGEGGVGNGSNTLMIHHNESGEAFIVNNATGNREASSASCAVQCVDDSCVDNACCPPAVTAMADQPSSSGADRS